MSNLPPGWIEQAHAAETMVAPYTGDPTSTWIGGPPGAQPKTANNPAGTYGGVPVMSLTAAVAAILAGPPPEPPL